MKQLNEHSSTASETTISGDQFSEITTDGSLDDWSWADKAFETIETSEKSPRPDPMPGWVFPLESWKAQLARRSLEWAIQRDVNAAFEFARSPSWRQDRETEESFFPSLLLLGERCGLFNEVKYMTIAILHEFTRATRFLENAKKQFVFEIHELKIPIFTHKRPSNDEPFYVVMSDGPRLIHGKFDSAYNWAMINQPFGWGWRPRSWNVANSHVPSGSCNSSSDKSKDGSKPQEKLRFNYNDVTAWGGSTDQTWKDLHVPAPVELVSILVETARQHGTPEEAVKMKLVLEAALRYDEWVLENELESDSETSESDSEPEFSSSERKSFEEFLTWAPGPESELSCSACATSNGTYLTTCGHRICGSCICDVARKSHCFVLCPLCDTILFAFADDENLLAASRTANFMNTTEILDRAALNIVCMIAILVARFPAIRSFVDLMLSEIFELNPAGPAGPTLRMVKFWPCSRTPKCFEKCTCIAQDQEKLAKCIFGRHAHKLFPCLDFGGEGLLLIGQYLNSAPFPESLGGIFAFFNKLCKNRDAELDLAFHFAEIAENELDDRPFMNATARIVSSILAIVVLPEISNKLLAIPGLLYAILDLWIVIFGIVFRPFFGDGYVAILLRMTFIWLTLVMCYSRSMFSIVFGGDVITLATFTIAAWPVPFLVECLLFAVSPW